MEKQIVDDYVFEKMELVAGNCYEFNNCTFKNCDFSKFIFDNSEFIDCRFEFCNLSMMSLVTTGLNKVSFVHCKMLGIDFSKCFKFLFSVSFEDCILNFCMFYKNELKNTIFKNCTMKEANFVETNLVSAKFMNCDLENAVFSRSNLEKADFVTARNYSFDPEVNRMKRARFSMPEVVRLLTKYDIEIS